VSYLRTTRSEAATVTAIVAPSPWSTFGPHAIGAERSLTVSSGTSFAQVAAAILQKPARAQNPDKDALACRSEQESYA
jgi:hypothetical protein